MSTLEPAIRLRAGAPSSGLVKWSRARDAVLRPVRRRGRNEERGAFVQHYESDFPDASNHLVPLVKLIAPDPRRPRPAIVCVDGR